MCTFKRSIKSDKSLIMADSDRILIDFLEVWTSFAETRSFRDLNFVDKQTIYLNGTRIFNDDTPNATDSKVYPKPLYTHMNI